MSGRAAEFQAWLGNEVAALAPQYQKVYKEMVAGLGDPSAPDEW